MPRDFTIDINKNIELFNWIRLQYLPKWFRHLFSCMTKLQLYGPCLFYFNGH